MLAKKCQIMKRIDCYAQEIPGLNTGGLLALSHNAAVSGGPLAGFPQPARVALAVTEAHRKTFWL